jgi:hypothetical protein
MKKEIAFIIAMVVFGAVLSVMIVGILGSIAIPSYTGSLLTIQEKADYEIMSQKFELVSKYPYVVVAILLLIAAITFILFFITLNRNFNNQLKGKTAKLKATAVALLCGACFLPLFIFTDNTAISWFTSKQPASDILTLIVYLLSFGLMWFIAGGVGWAGDFSSWRFSCCEKKSKPVFAFVLGAITGASAYGLAYLNEWVFAKYFFLVSEVLDRSGEMSWLGFKLLTYELVFMSSFSFAILAGVIITLVPQHITVKQRALKAIFPLVLLAILIPVISVGYNEAVTKYDLGKKSFAEAVGIPEKASEIKTLVLLSPDKEFIQEFPMEARANSVIASNTFAASYENLGKIETYVNNHKNSSVYYYAAMDGLINGYHRMFDIKKGIEFQAKDSEYFLLHRMLLLSRLRSLPVTKENINYIKAFTDENKWYISKRSALHISEIFMHFGMKKEAVLWANKAKEKGADISGITFLNETPLTNGIIKGRIWINGKTPANTKIGLFFYSGYLKEITDITLANRLIDAVSPDKFGRFTFKNLGKGNYVLAVLTDDKAIPYTTPAEKIKAENSPAIITLDAGQPIADLRDINLVVSK